MNTKLIISLILFVILAPLSVFLFLKYSGKTTSDNRSISKNVLYLTQPVTSFSGVVDKVDGNQITLTQTPTLSTPPFATATTNLAIPPSPVPTPPPLTYKVVVSDQTQISRPPTMGVNYLFKTNSPISPSQLSLADVTTGLSIAVSSKEDLRTLSDNTFEATMITLPQKMTTLNGKITGVSSNAIIIKAFAPLSVPMSAINPRSAPAMPEEKEYTISITPDTEISRMIMGSTPKPERLALSDLQKDMQVTVYTDADVTSGTQFTALRLEPMQTVALPVLPPPINP